MRILTLDTSTISRFVRNAIGAVSVLLVLSCAPVWADSYLAGTWTGKGTCRGFDSSGAPRKFSETIVLELDHAVDDFAGNQSLFGGARLTTPSYGPDTLKTAAVTSAVKEGDGVIGFFPCFGDAVAGWAVVKKADPSGNPKAKMKLTIHRSGSAIDYVSCTYNVRFTNPGMASTSLCP